MNWHKDVSDESRRVYQAGPGYRSRDKVGDEFAVEEALLTREKYDCEIYAISMGPEKAQDVLRNALALGVNGVYHIMDH